MVYFVMGPSGAGKSTYIKKNFPNADVVDLLEYQSKYFVKPDGSWRVGTINDILASYDDCEDALVDAIKKHINDNVDVVLEHTLLKDFRRHRYLKAAYGAGAKQIEAICILPSKEQYAKNIASRWHSEDVDGMLNMLDEFEIPSTSGTGFSSVKVIRSNG